MTVSYGEKFEKAVDYVLANEGGYVSDKNIATQVFDLSVNLGIRAATIVLQRALRAGGINVFEDGLIGPETLSGASILEAPILLAAIKAEAAGYYRTLAAQKPALQRYLNGWLNRAYRKII